MWELVWCSWTSRIAALYKLLMVCITVLCYSYDRQCSSLLRKSLLQKQLILIVKIPSRRWELVYIYIFVTFLHTVSCQQFFVIVLVFFQGDVVETFHFWIMFLCLQYGSKYVVQVYCAMRDIFSPSQLLIAFEPPITETTCRSWFVAYAGCNQGYWNLFETLSNCRRFDNRTQHSYSYWS